MCLMAHQQTNRTVLVHAHTHTHTHTHTHVCTNTWSSVDKLSWDILEEVGVDSQTEPSHRSMYITIVYTIVTMAGIVVHCSMYKHLSIGHPMVGLYAKSPCLIHDHSKAPHITGSGVLPVAESLRGCPLHWNLPSTRDIVLGVLESS